MMNMIVAIQTIKYFVNRSRKIRHSEHDGCDYTQSGAVTENALLDDNTLKDRFRTLSTKMMHSHVEETIRDVPNERIWLGSSIWSLLVSCLSANGQP